MGYERQGRLDPEIPWPQVRDALRAHFSSLGWNIIREDGGCFAWAFAERHLTGWDEDIVIGAEPSIYLLEHGWGKGCPDVAAIIADALKPLSVTVTWEEL